MILNEIIFEIEKNNPMYYNFKVNALSMKFSSSKLYYLSSKILFSFLLLFSQFTGPLVLASSTSKSNIEIKENYDEEFLLQNDIYLLGPGDVLSLIVMDAEELSNDKLDILPDGTVSVPLIGSVFVQDLSIDEAKTLIQQKLSEHLLLPEIQLTIRLFKPIRVTLIGEIEQPGIYILNKSVAEGVQSFATLVDAIQQAGGLTNKSNIENVKLVRTVKDTKNNAIIKKQAELNLWELINEGDQKNNPVLFNGDTILISRNNVTSKETTEMGFANLTPFIINVRILGQVKTPGQIELPVNTPLSQAVYSVGGPVEYMADTSRVYLIRLNRDGTVSSKKYKLNRAASTSDKFNPPLKANDVIYVGKSNFSKGVGALQTVTAPITPIVTILSFLKLID